jgi:hypothetical protein
MIDSPFFSIRRMPARSGTGNWIPRGSRPSASSNPAEAADCYTFLERIVKLEASATEAERAVSDTDRFG